MNRYNDCILRQSSRVTIAYKYDGFKTLSVRTCRACVIKFNEDVSTQ